MRRLIRFELLVVAAVLAVWTSAQVAHAGPSAAAAGATTEYVPFVSDFPKPEERYVPFVTDFPAAPAPAPADRPSGSGIDWSGVPVEEAGFAVAFLLAAVALLLVRRRDSPRPLDC